MENAIHLNVPLKVKLFYGKTWGNLQPLVINSQSNSNNSMNYNLQPVARCIFQNNQFET